MLLHASAACGNMQRLVQDVRTRSDLVAAHHSLKVL